MFFVIDFSTEEYEDVFLCILLRILLVHSLLQYKFFYAFDILNVLIFYYILLSLYFEYSTIQISRYFNHDCSFDIFINIQYKFFSIVEFYLYESGEKQIDRLFH